MFLALVLAAIAPVSAAPVPRVITVGPVVGDPLTSGKLLVAAYNSITNATAQFPVVVLVEPGTYNIGTAPLNMSSADVSLEGFGQDVSIVTGTGGTVLNISADCHLKSLSVIATAGAAIVATGGDVEIDDAHVSSTVSATNSAAAGVFYVFAAHGGIRNSRVMATNTSTNGNAQAVEVISTDPSTFQMDQDTFQATGGSFAVAVELGSPALLNNVQMSATNWGIELIQGTTAAPTFAMMNSLIQGATQFGIATGNPGTFTMTIQGSTITGSMVSIDLSSGGAATVNVANSELAGPVGIVSPSVVTCVGAYNAAFLPLSSSCQ